MGTLLIDAELCCQPAIAWTLNSVRPTVSSAKAGSFVETTAPHGDLGDVLKKKTTLAMGLLGGGAVGAMNLVFAHAHEQIDPSGSPPRSARCCPRGLEARHARKGGGVPSLHCRSACEGDHFRPGWVQA